MRLCASRSGFSILEMLVVLAVIATLAAITMGVVFRVQAAQREARATETIQKIQIAFDSQWRATIDQIKAEPIPDQVQALADNDTIRAAALHLEARMKREFPQTFAEATGTLTLNGYAYPASSAFNAVAGRSDTAENESAVLLFLCVSRAKAGISFDPDSIGAGIVVSKTVGGASFKVFNDPWRSPIGFYRKVPDTYPVLSEMDNAPYATGATGKKNVMDREGKLVSGGSWTGTNRTAAVGTAGASGSALLFGLTGIADPIDGRNRGPVIFSAGRNQRYSTNISTDNDDLYSFRIAATGRAN